MHKAVIFLIVVIFLASTVTASFAAKGTNVNEVKFIQYLDENTALEEVKNGNLDLYYFRIPSDRIESLESRKGLHVFESTGGSYSILVNPAESEKFNPFSIREVRFALNYLIDRKLIVNELMGGYGTPMISNYGPYDPDYLSIVHELESFHFRYNPALADEIISESLQKYKAERKDGVWLINGKPIEITVFIRSDDPVRKSIGEILSSELQKIGFTVKKDFGDLNKAFVVVYGSNPSELKWNLYTEGWGGRSAFVRYDPVGLGQMYSPWFSSMPGFNDPTYWNYKNDYLDSLTQKIYTGNFNSVEERTNLIQLATREAINESVRIFLASKIDQYVTNEKVSGVINDFGAGVPSRFTPINARTDSDSLTVGVKQIYQGAWNPVMGLSDSYSTQIWNALFDPAVFKHPYNGETFPVRSSWIVKTAGPNEKLAVPNDAIIWDPLLQKWKKVGDNIQATSKVTFDLIFSNWHHGKLMDMNDVLYSLYFTLEWGSEPLENDKTFDTEYTPRTAQTVKTIVAVKPIDENTVEVYVDYWHFDESEIADWASLWNSMPWEIFAAMEQAVIDGKVSFSRSGAVSKNINWLSLLVPNDAKLIQKYLGEFEKSNFIPKSLEQFESDSKYFVDRYKASIQWINEKNHAVISNGPFVLKSYSPESRTITIIAFADKSYPFEAGYWEEFEKITFPKITNVKMSEVISKGQPTKISITTEAASKIQYFLTNSDGKLVSNGVREVKENPTVLELDDEATKQFSAGANDLKIFAMSDTVLRPDIYATSFLAVDDQIDGLPQVKIAQHDKVVEEANYTIIAIAIIIAVIGIVTYLRKRAKIAQI